MPRKTIKSTPLSRKAIDLLENSRTNPKESHSDILMRVVRRSKRKDNNAASDILPDTSYGGTD
jgi:hypothetical protein